MDLITHFIDIILHLDDHLAQWMALYGPWIYAILFTIVFCETGLIVTPFLPGDSLLFVAGTLAAVGGMDIIYLMLTLFCAAVLGDSVNYFIGRKVGPQVFKWENTRWFNKAAFEKANAFFEKHGAMAIILARFMPLVRTFMPFCAGVAAMSQGKFLTANVLGAFIWVVSLTQAGYWFGNVPFIKDNLSAVILFIIIASLMPLVIAYFKSRAKTAV
jgi:membrane-associated protein